MGHTAHLRGTPPKLNPPTFYCPPVFREISLLFTCDISIRANINKQKDKSYAYVIVHFHFTQILMLPVCEKATHLNDCVINDHCSLGFASMSIVL